MNPLKPRWLSLFVAAVLGMMPEAMRGDCSLVQTGNIPLPDLGAATYQGFQGGLYPDGSDTVPAAHEAAGLAQAALVQPLNSAGLPDPMHGQIGLISIGLSNTMFEVSYGPDSFKPRADADPSKNPKVTIVNGAQGGEDASHWTDPLDETWTVLALRLKTAGVSPLQVQVAWMKHALEFPDTYGAFPAHAQTLQTDMEAIMRIARSMYPNLRIVYVSSRTRAYTEEIGTFSPEPFAYESGFAVKWMIADQINGINNLNFDPAKGPVVAPYLKWASYLWADGTTPRSDGFTWLCKDLQVDFTHPSTSGVAKVADQLLAFFKTDPTTSSWFLKPNNVDPPVVTVTARPSRGSVGLVTQFTANVSDPESGIASFSWNFDDGTFSNEQNPIKKFPAAGRYNVHFTVTAITGDYLTVTQPIVVSLRQK